MKIIYFLLVCFLWTQVALAQPIRISQNDGLPSNEVYYVFKDSKNFMWFATDQGVVKYDGKKFTKLDLPDNVVFKIKEDNIGKIWFFSFSGKLAYYHLNKVYPYKFNKIISEIKSDLIISNAFIKNNGDILLNSSHSNYDILNSGKIIKKFFKVYNSDSTIIEITCPNNSKSFFSRIESINNQIIDTIFLIDKRNGIKKVYKLAFNEELLRGEYGLKENQKGDQFFFIKNCIYKLLPNGEFLLKKMPSGILGITIDENNKLYISLLKMGARLIDSNLENEESIDFLENKTVTSIENDFENGIWFSTLEKGVYYLPKKVVCDLYPSLNKDLIFRMTTKNGYLVFGSQKGIGTIVNNKPKNIYPFNFQNVNELRIENKSLLIGATEFPQIKTNQFWRKEKFNGFLFDELIFIQTNTEIYTINEKQFFNIGYAIFNDNVKNNFTNNESKYFGRCKVFYNSHYGKLLSTKNDLFIFNDFFGIKPYFNNNEYFANGIYCIRELPNNSLAIGLKSKGITILKDSSILNTITEKDGLINNAIKYVLPIKNQLWVATANGISVISFSDTINFKKYTITNIGKSKGLSNIIINQLIEFKGSILAASSEGILEIKNPDSLIIEKPLPLPFYINNIQYGNIDTAQINSLSLPYKQNRFIVKFSAISFNAASDLKYYYRFYGSDTAWKETESKELIFENLAPDEYVLELKAAIVSDQRVSDTLILKVTIEKPWWQNNWFRVLAFILTFSGIYSFLKWRINLNRKRDAEKASYKLQLAELEQKALRSQMNPHFIFNCLTSIQQLIVFNKNDQANDYLIQFANLIRATLDISSNPFITIVEEKEYLTKYLKLEQLRLPEQFSYNFEIDASIDENKISIPSMILQPILENSIRHGLKNLADKKGLVTISMKNENDYINCIVSDNGVGGNYNASNRHGIKNILQRLNTFNKNMQVENIFSIENIKDTQNNNNGTIVKLKLPIKTI